MPWAIWLARQWPHSPAPNGPCTGLLAALATSLCWGTWALGKGRPEFKSLFYCSQALWPLCVSTSLVLSFLFFFWLFKNKLVAYESSQAWGWIIATAASHSLSHSNTGIWATCATYTTAHGNAKSLTHWVRPGIKPSSSWILVGFVSAAPQQELPRPFFFSWK